MVPDEEVHTAEEVDGDGRYRLPQREVPAAGDGGNERGGRVDDRGRQPECLFGHFPSQQVYPPRRFR